MKKKGRGTRRKPSTYRTRRKKSWWKKFPGLRSVLGSKRQTQHYAVAMPAWQRSTGQTRVPPWLFSVLTLVVTGWLFYGFASSDLFYIRNVRSEGNWRLPESELLAISGLKDVNVFWADTQAAERALVALPDIESVRVWCKLPANCVIELAERPVTLVWLQGDAQVWIGADGVAVPARGELPNAVVLDAVESTALKPGDRLSMTLIEAVKTLEQRQPEVRVYQYSDRYGFSFMSQYGWPVRLGHGQDIVARLDLLNSLDGYFLSKGVVPTFVDVRYLEAPYYEE